MKDARSLQSRWKDEAGVDIVQRVIDQLRQTTNMKVQVAREGDHEYFAGVLRAVDRGIGVHADYAPYVSTIHQAFTCLCFCLIRDRLQARSFNRLHH